jgi:hypothetical protein
LKPVNIPFSLGFLSGHGDQIVGLVLKHAKPSIATIFNHQLHTASSANTGDRWRRSQCHCRFRNLFAELLQQRFLNGVGRCFWCLSFIEVFENDKHGTEVGSSTAESKRVARDGVNAANTRSIQSDAFDLRQCFQSSLGGRRIRQLHASRQITFVLSGMKPVGREWKPVYVSPTSPT